MKKKISLLLAIVMLLSFVLTACSEEESEPVQTQSYYGTKETDKFVVNQAAASYVVVLPADAMEMESFASEELVAFMEQSTGCTLSVVTDTAVPAGSQRKSRPKGYHCSSQYKPRSGRRRMQALAL